MITKVFVIMLRGEPDVAAGRLHAAVQQHHGRALAEPQMPWYSARDSGPALLAGRWFGMLVCYLRDGERVYETYWTSGRATEVMAPS
jgi:hypothetical protein